MYLMDVKKLKIYVDNLRYSLIEGDRNSTHDEFAPINSLICLSLIKKQINNFDWY